MAHRELRIQKDFVGCQNPQPIATGARRELENKPDCGITTNLIQTTLELFDTIFMPVQDVWHAKTIKSDTINDALPGYISNFRQNNSYSCKNVNFKPRKFFKSFYSQPHRAHHSELTHIFKKSYRVGVSEPVNLNFFAK